MRIKRKLLINRLEKAKINAANKIITLMALQPSTILETYFSL